MHWEMGNPPCLKLLSHWVPPEKLATKLAIWNPLHSIGAGIITILCGYIMGVGMIWTEAKMDAEAKAALDFEWIVFEGVR